MITYHKNRQQGLSIIKSLIFAPSEMEDFIYIYKMINNIYTRKKNSSGVNFACISQIIKKCLFFPASEIYVLYIYTFSSTLPPKHRTEFIIFEHHYVVFGPNLANLECAHVIIKYHMCSWAL